MSDSKFKPVKFGRYVLEECIGRGGMAEIFRAKSPGAHGFEKTLVIKRILPEQARNPQFVEWFIDEAKLMMRLDHPKIVQVFDFGEVEGRYYIAMEYVRGIDCLELLRKCARRRWRPAPIIAVHIIADVMDALQYAHTLTDSDGRPLNLVHADVSPSNIFLSELGEVKLSDFGIAHMGLRRGRPDSGVVRGKYGYLPPEAVAGLPVDHRADIFSAGVVLAELLMVQRLFRGKNYLEVLLQVRDGRLDRLDEFGQHISADLRRILEYALARDPYMRYQNAAAFRDALHRYLFDRQQLLRATSVRKFMSRLAASSEEVLQQAIDHEDQPKTPAGGVPGAVGPTLKHGRRRILLGPPPQPMPVPQGPSHQHALAKLSGGEMLLAGRAEGSGRLTEDDFGIVASLPPIEGHGGEFVQGLESGLDPGLSDYDETIPPLAEAARRNTTSVTEIERPTPDIEYDLSERSLVSILFAFAVGAETGLIVLRAGDTVKEIYITDGDPDFVASNLPDELFGQFLLAEGVITHDELDRALAILPRYKGKLGEALVALGLLRPMQVLRLLTRQVRQKVFNAFAWETGIASYYRGRTCERDSAPLGLDAFEVVEAGVAELPDPVLVQRLAGAMSQKPLAVDPPRVPPEVFRVGGYPREVYGLLRGERTLAELLAEAGEAEQPGKLARMSYLLLECGLATLK
ncbi:MAG: protein kinase [bacterium]